MAAATKRRQGNQAGARAADLSHMTRPKLDPLIQQTLESVGMKARKAFSDGSFRKQMTEPKAQIAMGLAMVSDAEVKKPLPFYEIKSAKDPWEKFRAAGQKQVNITRVPKRTRDESIYLDMEMPPMPNSLAEPTTALPASYSSSDDPNDLEFTNPPWLASQESFMSDDDMVE